MTDYETLALAAPSPDLTAEEAVQVFRLPLSSADLLTMLRILPGIHPTGRRRPYGKGRPAFTFNAQQLAALFTALSEWLDRLAESEAS